MTCQRGFTLIEMVVALTIFSFIGIAGYQMLSGITSASHSIQKSVTNNDQLIRLMLFLNQDLSQLADRPIRDVSGAIQPAITYGQGNYLLEFSRYGWQNPLKEKRGSVQRIAYNLEEHAIVRYAWNTMDRAPGTVPARQILMSGVREFSLRFYDRSSGWLPSFTPFYNQTLALPAAIEVKITHDYFHDLRSVILTGAPLSPFTKPSSNSGADKP